MKLCRLITIFCALLIVSCSQHQSNRYILSPQDFSEKLSKTPESILIDVRTPNEFDAGHLPKARNFNWASEAAFDHQIAQLDKNKPVFLYDLIGGRSTGARRMLIAEGFSEVYELDGGLMSWRESGFPETKIMDFGGMTRMEFEKFLDSEKPVLVDFYTRSCAPCLYMMPILEEVSKSSNINLVQIDIDDHQSISKELHLEAVPVIQYYKNRMLVWSHVGTLTKNELIKKLQ